MTVKDDDEENQNEAEEGKSSTGDADGEKREFPDAFYDSNTKKIMVDPVVDANGDSYDRTTIDNLPSAQRNGTTYYPNRALKSIIERDTELASNSMRASLRRFDEKLKDGFGRLVEQSAFAIEHHPLPESFYCLITCDLMVDPVITPEGFSYERDAIVHWISVNKCSPMTRKDMGVGELRENNALYDLIQEERNRTDESLHPSIRRWKESGAPSQRPDRPAGQAVAEPAAAAVPSPALNYPTTEAEIRRRRFRRRRAANVTLWGIILAVLVVLGIIPVSLVGLLIGVLICMCCATPPNTERYR